MSNDIIPNYIYLLWEREFIKTQDNVYKIGRTNKKNLKRFNKYSKDSILLLQIICTNSKNMETNIIKVFTEKFIRREDIGNEYFEGNYKDMIDIIYSIINNENSSPNENSPLDDEDTSYNSSSDENSALDDGEIISIFTR